MTKDSETQNTPARPAGGENPTPDSEFSYIIAGKKYTQRQLVWAQTKQLKNLLQGIRIPADFDVMSIIDILGDKIPKAIAIILREEGLQLKKKDVDKLAELFEEELGIETMVEIIENFFFCNPLGSLFEKLTGTFDKMIQQTKSLTKLMKQSPSSAEETSQNETKSSGDIHQESANLTSNTANEK